MMRPQGREPAEKPAAVALHEFSSGPDGWKLSPMSFQLPQAQLSMVLGENGSGKTILLRSLLGDYKASAGELSFYRPRSQLTVSWLPATQTLPFDFRVIELVEMGRFPYHHGFPGRSDRIVAMESLYLLGIRDLANRRYLSLSQGEQVKVQLARCLAQDPDILVLDEPCANLDIGSKLEVLARLTALCRAGKTVIMSHHDLHSVAGYADYCCILKNGQLVTSGPTLEALQPEILEEAFRVKVTISASPEASDRPTPPLMAFTRED